MPYHKCKALSHFVPGHQDLHPFCPLYIYSLVGQQTFTRTNKSAEVHFFNIKRTMDYVKQPSLTLSHMTNFRLSQTQSVSR